MKTARFLKTLPVGICSLCVILLGFSGCGSTITTRIETPPSGNRDPSPKIDSALTEAAPSDLARWAGTHPDRLREAAQILLQRARKEKPASDGGRGGWALAACELAWKSLLASGVPASRWHDDPRTREAASLYQAGLAIFIFENARVLATGQGTLRFETPLGPLAVTPRFAQNSRFETGYFDTLIPAEYVETTGFSERVSVQGLGTPLVGVRKRTPARTKEMQFQVPRTGSHIALGSLARFRNAAQDQAAMDLDFYDLDQSPSVRLRGDEVPLAADFTAPMALSFAGTNDLSVGIHALFNLSAGFGNDGVYLTEPFDPDRTPVLLLHGLFASPLVWRNVVAKCQEAPAIRKNYQFWYGFFSTGMPITPSAALIRAHIAAIRQAGDPAGTSRASKTMVVVGHSMGGVIARMLATDIGDHYWKSLTDQPFADVSLKPENRETVRSWFFWNPATDINRIVFLATPHLGTPMADNLFIRLAQSTTEAPKSFFEFSRSLAAGGGPVPDNNSLRSHTKPFTHAFEGIVTGVDSLSPQAPIYRVFAHAPLVDGVVTHSIIGDRGRGDSPDSSDGVVDYWSSHLASAKSELILPSTHELQRVPQCGLEVQRILLENLGLKSPAIVSHPQTR